MDGQNALFIHCSCYVSLSANIFPLDALHAQHPLLLTETVAKYHGNEFTWYGLYPGTTRAHPEMPLAKIGSDLRSRYEGAEMHPGKPASPPRPSTCKTRMPGVSHGVSHSTTAGSYHSTSKIPPAVTWAIISPSLRDRRHRAGTHTCAARAWDTKHAHALHQSRCFPLNYIQIVP